jgi:hypothetical protein
MNFLYFDGKFTNFKTKNTSFLIYLAIDTPKCWMGGGGGESSKPMRQDKSACSKSGVICLGS